MSHTVLVCDDAPYMRTLVSGILQRAGFDVVGEAETGVEAVEQYKRLRPDVVTLDLIMRDMGGIEALRAIRQFDDKARVLVCSGLAQQRLVAEAKAAGAAEFVAKPFQPSRLLEAIRYALS